MVVQHVCVLDFVLCQGISYWFLLYVAWFILDYLVVIKVTFCLIFLILHLICNVFLHTTPDRYPFFLGNCFITKILAHGIFLLHASRIVVDMDKWCPSDYGRLQLHRHIEKICKVCSDVLEGYSKNCQERRYGHHITQHSLNKIELVYEQHIERHCAKYIWPFLRKSSGIHPI